MHMKINLYRPPCKYIFECVPHRESQLSEGGRGISMLNKKKDMLVNLSLAYIMAYLTMPRTKLTNGPNVIAEDMAIDIK